MSIITTEHLILRPWKEEDLEPFSQLNADSLVMKYFLSVLSRQESDQLAKKISDRINEKGWGFWAVSLKDTDKFVGFIGLEHVYFTSHFTPAVEIGWRLAFDYWGKGFATEGAKASLRYGFETLKLGEIISFTAVQNKRSVAVMEKIGMRHDPKDDFDNPMIPDGHTLKKHVLYRIMRNFGHDKKKTW